MTSTVTSLPHRSPGFARTHGYATGLLAARVAIALALLATSVTSAGAAVHRSFDMAINASHQKLTLGPPQIVVPVKRGNTYRLPVTIRNLTTAPYDLTLSGEDLEPARNDRSLVTLSHHAATHAGLWVHPEVTALHLAPGESATFDVTIVVPRSATPGLAPAAIVARHRIAPTVVSTAHLTRVIVDARLAGELLLEVDGPARESATLHAHGGRRLVTHGDRPTFTALLANDGMSLVQAKGQMSLNSRLAANADATIDIRPAVKVLPSGRRRINVTWTETPWLGWYEPRMELQYGHGEQVVATWPSVFVLPPWWVFVAIVVAIALPVWTRWRRRRRIARAYDETGSDQADGE